MFATFSELLGLVLVFLAALLSLVFGLLARRGIFRPALRPISAYQALAGQVGEAIESGGRVHVSVGPSGVVDERTITTLMGLTFLNAVAERSAISDRSPLGTTANAVTFYLVSDTIRRAYQRGDGIGRFERTAPRLVALDPLALAGGATDIVADESVSANVLVGSFGVESALITEAGMRHGLSQTLGSDQLAGQAVAYATADHPLLGEELFMAHAYLQGGASGLGSLAAQDVLRWVVVAVIIVGVVLQTLGAIR